MALRFILTNIDALRSTASSARSDAMAKEGHVDYDVSSVPVKARAGPTTGRGWYGWVLGCDVSSNYSFFLVACARCDDSYANPPTHNRSLTVNFEESWEGDGRPRLL